jgi:hypothetical protein
MPSSTLYPEGAVDVEKGGCTGKFIYKLHWICGGKKISITTIFCKKYTYT